MSIVSAAVLIAVTASSQMTVDAVRSAIPEVMADTSTRITSWSAH